MARHDGCSLLRRLRQCGFSVAGASRRIASVGARAGCEEAEFGNGDGSVGWSRRRRERRGGEEQRRCLFSDVGVMWNAETLLAMMVRGMSQEGADRWSVGDLIANCRCGAACGFRVRAGIFCCGGCCAEVASNADHQNTSDLLIERNATDLFWPGNDVTVSCSSVILKYTVNAGCELQNEALADADSLQQNIRRPFVLTQIVESRVGHDRRESLCDSKCSATFKKQVFDAQSLRIVEGSRAISSRLDVLQLLQPCFYRGFNDSLFQSFMALVWKSIWRLWHFFLLQWMKSVVLFQFRDPTMRQFLVLGSCLLILRSL